MGIPTGQSDGWSICCCSRHRAWPKAAEKMCTSKMEGLGYVCALVLQSVGFVREKAVTRSPGPEFAERRACMHCDEGGRGLFGAGSRLAGQRI